MLTNLRCLACWRGTVKWVELTCWWDFFFHSLYDLFVQYLFIFQKYFDWTSFIFFPHLCCRSNNVIAFIWSFALFLIVLSPPQGQTEFLSCPHRVNGEERYSAVTQFEATDARRCFPCWDEPALKATFDITLVVPSDRVPLSNMVCWLVLRFWNLAKTCSLRLFVCRWMIFIFQEWCDGHFTASFLDFFYIGSVWI